MHLSTILERLSPVGVALCVVGIALNLWAPRLCARHEKAVLPVKFAGLALVLVATLILLDFIPV